MVIDRDDALSFAAGFAGITEDEGAGMDIDESGFFSVVESGDELDENSGADVNKGESEVAREDCNEPEMTEEEYAVVVEEMMAEEVEEIEQEDVEEVDDASISKTAAKSAKGISPKEKAQKLEAKKVAFEEWRPKAIEEAGLTQFRNAIGNELVDHGYKNGSTFLAQVATQDAKGLDESRLLTEEELSTSRLAAYEKTKPSDEELELRSSSNSKRIAFEISTNTPTPAKESFMPDRIESTKRSSALSSTTTATSSGELDPSFSKPSAAPGIGHLAPASCSLVFPPLHKDSEILMTAAFTTKGFLAIGAVMNGTNSPYIADLHPLKNSSAPRKTSKSNPFSFPDRPQPITDAFYAIDGTQSRICLLEQMFCSKFLEASRVWERLDEWIQHGNRVNVEIASTVDDYRMGINIGFGVPNRGFYEKHIEILAQVFGFDVKRAEIKMHLPELDGHGVAGKIEAILPMHFLSKEQHVFRMVGHAIHPSVGTYSRGTEKLFGATVMAGLAVALSIDLCGGKHDAGAVYVFAERARPGVDNARGVYDWWDLNQEQAAEIANETPTPWESVSEAGREFIIALSLLPSEEFNPVPVVMNGTTPLGRASSARATRAWDHRSRTNPKNSLKQAAHQRAKRGGIHDVAALQPVEAFLQLLESNLSPTPSKLHDNVDTIYDVRLLSCRCCQVYLYGTGKTEHACFKGLPPPAGAFIPKEQRIKADRLDSLVPLSAGVVMVQLQQSMMKSLQQAGGQIEECFEGLEGKLGSAMEGVKRVDAMELLEQDPLAAEILDLFEQNYTKDSPNRDHQGYDNFVYYRQGTTKALKLLSAFGVIFERNRVEDFEDTTFGSGGKLLEFLGAASRGESLAKEKVHVWRCSKTGGWKVATGAKPQCWHGNVKKTPKRLIRITSALDFHLDFVKNIVYSALGFGSILVAEKMKIVDWIALIRLFRWDWTTQDGAVSTSRKRPLPSLPSFSSQDVPFSPARVRPSKKKKTRTQRS